MLITRVGRILFWIVSGLGLLAFLVALFLVLAVRALIMAPTDEFGTVEDEAKLASLSINDFRGASDPYFVEMDKGLLRAPERGQDEPSEIREVATLTRLSNDEVRDRAVRGQNMWLVWTGGNDRFWDFAARKALGSFDLLKIISSHPSQAYGRENRFRYLGLVNEPCFGAPEGPDPARFGLWLDQRDATCGPDPFADPEAYPGVRIGARGKPTPIAAEYPESTDDGALPVGSYYGEPTGVLGLRLFPNPDFDAEAAAAWDPERYYTDPSYYDDADLVRPYRVGMSCAFCHVGPNPIDPPDNIEAPEWRELTSNPGAQYFWVDRVFFWNTRPRSEPDVPSPNESNFLYQLFHTNPPGSLDTSLVSSDYMNNPRTMNAVYEVAARLELARHLGHEVLQGDERANLQFGSFEEFRQNAALTSLFDEDTGRVASMRVLKDGADSVGTLGALNRVYLNIGLFSEEWLLHFRAFFGGQRISPIRIEDAQRNSVYWQATEAQSIDMAIFFLVTARADHLEDAPGGREILAEQSSAEAAERGKIVFAENCAACHSSKQPAPDPAFGVDQGECEGGGSGPNYRLCWDRFWTWAQSDSFKADMVALMGATDAAGRETFLDGNYLSTERRVPIDVLGTNTCSAIATNGLKGDIWDNFTSSTYKSLPPPGEVVVHHPESGSTSNFQSLGNGRGYIRPASLVSLWSTAPYLLNNSVGHDPRYDGPASYGAAGSQEGATASLEQGDASESSEPRSGADGRAQVTDALGSPADRGDQVYGPASCPSEDPNNPYLPCTENRVSTFQHSIRQMLSPELRLTDDGTAAPVPGYIYRTTAPSCLMVPPGYAPELIRRWSGVLSWLAPWAVTPEGGIEIGPFPEGFPVNALANSELLPDNDESVTWAHAWKVLSAGWTIRGALSDLGGQCSPDELADPAVLQHAQNVVRERGLVDALVGLSKCPDYVVNRGHTFGAQLSAEDKEALIAYLLRL
ncbi:hypothetical protein [Rubellimicrobium arenae]|uniref:hypothetical protein n=1 Tax=Rubellimicrobium arenae TaxID=2817372 RepID=UPI001B305750|nr:hypothetical protein [Rubellimicrobium arenae]